MYCTIMSRYLKTSMILLFFVFFFNVNVPQFTCANFLRWNLWAGPGVVDVPCATAIRTGGMKFTTFELVLTMASKESRWWFQMFFYFHPYLGKWSNLTNISQMGWNQQLGIISIHLWFLIVNNLETSQDAFVEKLLARLPVVPGPMDFRVTR